jgi:hypothetical protein
MPMAATFPQLQLTPPVTAAAYAIGAGVGGLLTFANAVTEVAGSAMVQSVTVTFTSGVVPTLDLVVFTANPSASTITDRVAVAIAAADLGKIAGVVHLTDSTLLGAAAPSVMQGTAQVMPIDLASGVALYGVLITRSAVTLGSTTDALVSLNLLWG